MKRLLAALILAACVTGCVSMRAPMEIETKYYDEQGNVTSTESVKFNQVQRALGNTKAIQDSSGLEVDKDGRIELIGPGQREDSELKIEALKAFQLIMAIP